MTPTQPADSTFALVRNDLPLRILRMLGIAPKHGLGVVRRAVFFALLCWLPIVVWAWMGHRLLDSMTGEPLLLHFGIHVRCLIAVPLLILAEAPASVIINRILQQFLQSGLIPPSRATDFHAAIARAGKLRDATMPWIAVLALSLVWLAGSPNDMYAHELSWAAVNGEMGWGGWWFKYVARTVFVFLVLGWIWRILLLVMLFRQIQTLDLSLVPNHPDRMAGLGFLQAVPKTFSLVTFALAAVLASRWAHDSIYHDAPLASFKMPLLAFILIWSVMLLLPALVFCAKMIACKRQALAEYRALTAMHGRLMHARWVTSTASDQTPHPMFEAPELGASADVGTIYQSVEHMRTLPIGKASVMGILLPMLVPMLLVAMTQFPLKDILTTLMKALM